MDIMEMVRLAGTPTGIPPGTRLLRFTKSAEFLYDISLAKNAGRAQAAKEVWHLVELLRAQAPLPSGYNVHNMAGAWAGWKNCHVEGDFVLLWQYAMYGNEKILRLARCGTHSYLRI